MVFFFFYWYVLFFCRYSIWKWGTGSNFVVGVQLRLTNIAIKVPVKTSGQFFLIQENGFLIVEECSFSSNLTSATIVISLIKITGSITCNVAMFNVKINDVIFNSSSVFDFQSSNSVLTIVGLHFENVKRTNSNVFL
jgi:hypothetical protein